MPEGELAEKVEKRKKSFWKEIPPKTLIWFFAGFVLVMISNLPNKGFIILGGVVALIWLSRGKGVVMPKITESEAIDIVKKKIREKQLNGDLPYYNKYEISPYCDRKSIGGKDRYVFSGVREITPFNRISYLQAKILLDGDCYLQKATGAITGREVPPVYIPAYIKKIKEEMPQQWLKMWTGE